MNQEKIHLRDQAGITVVELLDEEITRYNEAALKEVENALLGLVEREAPPRLLVSFARVKYVGSCILGILILLRKRIAERGGKLELCCIPSILQDMFVLTQLDQVFDIFMDEQEGISSFDLKK